MFIIYCHVTDTGNIFCCFVNGTDTGNFYCYVTDNFKSFSRYRYRCIQLLFLLYRYLKLNPIQDIIFDYVTDTVNITDIYGNITLNVTILDTGTVPVSLTLALSISVHASNLFQFRNMIHRIYFFSSHIYWI